MINSVTLTGRTANDVELRYTQSGKPVGKFSLAVKRRFKGRDGQDETDFIKCVIWGKSAEAFANYVKKGDLVGVVGRIQNRSYDNNQGQKVRVTEVVVEDFSFLQPKGTSNNGGYQQHQRADMQASQLQASQQSFNGQPPADPFKGNGQPINISEDDLPF